MESGIDPMLSIAGSSAQNSITGLNFNDFPIAEKQPSSVVVPQDIDSAGVALGTPTATLDAAVALAGAKRPDLVAALKDQEVQIQNKSKELEDLKSERDLGTSLGIAGTAFAVLFGLAAGLLIPASPLFIGIAVIGALVAGYGWNKRLTADSKIAMAEGDLSAMNKERVRQEFEIRRLAHAMEKNSKLTAKLNTSLPGNG